MAYRIAIVPPARMRSAACARVLPSPRRVTRSPPRCRLGGPKVAQKLQAATQIAQGPFLATEHGHFVSSCTAQSGPLSWIGHAGTAWVGRVEGRVDALESTDDLGRSLVNLARVTSSPRRSMVCPTW
jgi:hypothetical protein